MRKVLILNGSFCELPLVETCHRLGYYVITTGNMPGLMAHQYSDEYIQADYSDYKRILEIVKENRIDSILSCANDFGSITASYVSEQMGWKTHDTFHNSKMLHHKDLFKEYIQRKGFPTPQSVVFDREDDAMASLDSVSFPIIVKANDLTGGKGILKAETKEEAATAIINAFSKSRSKHILIEPFLKGDQQTFVSFIHKKKVVASASCDSYSFVNPYLIQSETLPAKDIESIQGELIRIIESIVSELNLVDGIFALQYIRSGSNFYIIEMMRRPFGNQFLQLVEYSTGFPWHLAQIIAETGGDWSMINKAPALKPYCGHFGVMSSVNGKLKRWNVPDEIRKHVFKEFVMKKPGEMIWDCLNERVAFLHFEYNDYEDMQKSVKQFFSSITVEVE